MKYADDWFALENDRISDSHDTDMPHPVDGCDRNRSGIAFHTLNTSTAPIVPDVVTFTRLDVVASSFVTTPVGWLDPEPVAVAAAIRSSDP